jgi:uncharacterized protein YdiU (UPF0061 family)
MPGSRPNHRVCAYTVTNLNSDKTVLTSSIEYGGRHFENCYNPSFACEHFDISNHIY